VPMHLRQKNVNINNQTDLVVRTAFNEDDEQPETLVVNNNDVGERTVTAMSNEKEKDEEEKKPKKKKNETEEEEEEEEEDEEAMTEDDIVTPLISLGGGSSKNKGNRHNKPTKQSVSTTTLNVDDVSANEYGAISNRKVSKAKASISSAMSANNPLLMLSKSNSRIAGGEDMALTIMKNILK
jgi:hypothetical protein